MPRRPRRASISSSRTTASRSPTSCPTRASTTRRTARTTATAPTTTAPGTTESRGRAKSRRSSPRGRAIERNLLTLLFASRGTPMLAMGAELGFSQHGNNNAYAQDNATTAIDWSAADGSLIAFTRRLAEVRRAHPALSRDAFLTGAPFDASRLPDVEWRDADGPMAAVRLGRRRRRRSGRRFRRAARGRRRSCRLCDEPFERRRRDQPPASSRRHGVARAHRHP